MDMQHEVNEDNITSPEKLEESGSAEKCPETTTTCREVNVVETTTTTTTTTCRDVNEVEDDAEVPHRRLKIDKNTVNVNGSRRRCSSRRKSQPQGICKRIKPKLALPIPADESKSAVGEEEFPYDEEDVVCQSDLSRTYESMNDSRLAQLVPSLQTDVVYVEQTNGHGFCKQNKSRFTDYQEKEMHFVGNNDKSTILEFVLKMHVRFRSLGTMTHGLVAGIALSQCIFVFSFTNKTLKENYSQLATLFQSLYYLLLTISTVSILDRFINIGSDWGALLKHLIAKPLRAVILISYLLSLIFSVSLAQFDDSLSVHENIPPSEITPLKLDTWKVLNMFRVITSIIGWFSISFSPTDDITALTIEDMISKEKEEEFERCEMRSTPMTISHEDI